MWLFVCLQTQMSTHLPAGPPYPPDVFVNSLGVVIAKHFFSGVTRWDLKPCLESRWVTHFGSDLNQCHSLMCPLQYLFINTPLVNLHVSECDYRNSLWSFLHIVLHSNGMIPSCGSPLCPTWSEHIVEVPSPTPEPQAAQLVKLLTGNHPLLPSEWTRSTMN